MLSDSAGGYMSEMHDDNDDLFGAYDEDRRRARKDRNSVQDLLRRAIENTFDTVKDSGALSKEALAYLLQQGDKGRKEIVKVAAKELGDFLRATDISSEVVKVLTAVQMDMTISIRFKRNPDGTGVVPSVGSGPEDPAEGVSEPESPSKPTEV